MQAPHSFITEIEDFVIFSINRPAILNALSTEVLTSLSDLMIEIERNSYSGLIITGVGRAFSAGTDLEEIASMTTEQGLLKCDYARQLFLRLHRAPFISVAAIPDLAYGGGLELAAACTFRVAAKNARLAMPEIKLDAMPAYGGTQLLPYLIGPARAKEITLSGRALGAKEALEMGLINRISGSKEGLLESAIDLLKSTNQNSDLATRAIIESINAYPGYVSDVGLEKERETFTRVVHEGNPLKKITEFTK